MKQVQICIKEVSMGRKKARFGGMCASKCVCVCMCVCARQVGTHVCMNILMCVKTYDRYMDATVGQADDSDNYRVYV